MKSLWVGLFVAMALAPFAEAGGIAFKKHYTGTHPISGNRVELSIVDGGIVDGQAKKATLTVQDSLGSTSGLMLHAVSRNAFEAVYELRQAGSTPLVIARVVTTGDCQVVEKAALVFASGVSLTIEND